jgi:uncharacterized membrane protein YedE/YeeE
MQTEILANISPEACEAPNSQKKKETTFGQLKYLLVGMIFGVVFIKAEIISWYRIQEMFLFDSFHMYGIIGSAVVTGIISVFLIKKLNIKTIYGEKPIIQEKVFNKGQIYGGLIFGIGWALTGACPGPLTGVLIYGKFREKLPH